MSVRILRYTIAICIAFSIVDALNAVPIAERSIELAGRSYDESEPAFRQADEDDSIEDSDEDDEGDDAEREHLNAVLQQQQQQLEDSLEDSFEEGGDGGFEDDRRKRRRRDTEAAVAAAIQQEKQPMSSTVATNEQQKLEGAETDNKPDESTADAQAESAANVGESSIAATTVAPSRKSSVLVLIVDALKKVTNGLPTEQVATNTLQYFQLFEHFLQQAIEQVIGDDDDDDEESTTISIDLEGLESVAENAIKAPEANTATAQLETPGMQENSVAAGSAVTAGMPENSVAAAPAVTSEETKQPTQETVPAPMREPAPTLPATPGAPVTTVVVQPQAMENVPVNKPAEIVATNSV